MRGVSHHARPVLCLTARYLCVHPPCFVLRSGMSGFMQTTFFFGYNGMVCFGFFLMLGTVGWRASLLFVRQIYKAIKCE
jgi:hypothetical protein